MLQIEKQQSENIGPLIITSPQDDFQWGAVSGPFDCKESSEQTSCLWGCNLSSFLMNSTEAERKENYTSNINKYITLDFIRMTASVSKYGSKR